MTGAAPSARLAGASVVVTGASGFIGKHLCRSLRTLGADVIAFGHGATPADALGTRMLDLTDREAVRAAFGNIRGCRVVHLAAVRPTAATPADFQRAFATNVHGLLNLVEALDDRCPRFVALGTTEEFGAAPAPFNASQREAPVTPYGVSKLAATQLLQGLARTGTLSAVVLRPTVVYGPGQGADMFLPALTTALLQGHVFPMSAGEQTRDYVYVDDVVSAITRALIAPTVPTEALPVSSGTPVRIADLARFVATLIGDGAIGRLSFGARAYRAGEPMEYWADNSPTRSALDWTPAVGLDDGLRRTIAHYRSAMAGE